MKIRLSQSIRRATLSALLVAPLAAGVSACTDLTEVPKDTLTPANAFRTEDEILAGVASVYATLRRAMWGYYNLSEVSTDEMVVPTRGQNWFDNGRWVEIHQQRWTPNSNSALDDINGVWNDLFGGVARANLMIQVIERTPSATQQQTLAELRTLRAWYYYILQDMFGGLPLVTTTAVEPRARVARDSVFRFIERELQTARTALPVSWPAGQYGRVTRGAADAILASLYLNAQVFSGSVTTAGLTPGAAKWDSALVAANRVINSGQYTLAANPAEWRANFSPTNNGAKEHVFVVAHSDQQGLGMSLPMRSLYYTQHSLGPWNGFATLAATYNAFDDADTRKAMWLVGPQINYSTGAPANVQGSNAQAAFVPTIGSITSANDFEGARPLKFPPAASAPDGDSHPNDFPFFRLAEMYLIRAEALNELGRTAEAIADLNLIRGRVFETPQPLPAGLSQAQVREAILRERLFELAGEAKRRQDQIRMGVYTAPRQFKEQTEPFRILMPIPSTQIQTNPLLQQNPGYTG